MHRHRPSKAVGRLDHGLHLLEGEGGQGLPLRPHPVVGIELDPVRPAGRLPAHGLHRCIDAADLLRALGWGEIGAIVADGGTIGPEGHDGPGGHRQAGAGDQAVIDGLAQRDIGIARPFRAQVPQAGEAGHQGCPRLLHRPQHPVVLRVLQHLIVPQGLVVGVQQQVGVQVHQAGHQGLPRQVDHRRPGGCGQLRRRSDGGDPVPGDQHRPARVQAGARGPDRLGPQQHGGRHRLSRLGRRGDPPQDKGQGQAEQTGQGAGDTHGTGSPSDSRPNDSHRCHPLRAGTTPEAGHPGCEGPG